MKGRKDPQFPINLFWTIRNGGRYDKSRPTILTWFLVGLVILIIL